MAYEWIVDGLEVTWNATSRLLKPIAPSSYDAQTACPGWSVRDVLSHLVGFELMLEGVETPAMSSSPGSHVKNPIGLVNERFVDARRATPGDKVLDEFVEVTHRSLQRLRTLDPARWEVIGWSPEGDAPYHRFQETRLLDSWIHLQDLRDALLQPEDDHGVGEEVVLNRFEAAVPYVVGRRAAAPEGATVRVNLIGRLARTISVEVVHGRAQPVDVIDVVPNVEITTPVALFWRRAAGRISAEAFLSASATNVSGDRELAVRIAEGLAIMI